MASTQQSTYRIFYWLSLALFCAYGQPGGTDGTSETWLDHRLSTGSPSQLPSAAHASQACLLRWQPYCATTIGTLPACVRLGSPAAASLDNVCLSAYSSNADAPDPQIIFAQLDPIDTALDTRTLPVIANSAQYDNDATVKFDSALGWRAAHGSLMPFSTATLARWHADRWINESDLQRESQHDSDHDPHHDAHHDPHHEATVRYF
ncbi:MAG: hypothetical protein HQ497_06325 [SAR86 cluster bacterium]|uniref:Uncharacterized protein n=1 Tax=SAR86 cluster bacterium TaxID=2030880 RepID=A0A973A7R2_9GAMM|nr:hypothetical protein [SAR86 cluster bacterium]